MGRLCSSNPTSGIITTIAGQINNQGGPEDETWVEGAAATSVKINHGCGIVFGTDGSLYVADCGAQVVYAVLPTGRVHAIAGTRWTSGSNARDDSATLYGNGGPATSGVLSFPNGCCFSNDCSSTLYFKWIL